MKVNEIFYSLQGEGCFTGTASVFIRLSGCNLKCPFCDTDHIPGTEMTEEEIVAKVKEHGAHHVVITGGEPTLQLNVRLTTLLHEAGCFIQIETNGTRQLPEGCDIDWITCSPKEGGEIVINRIDELKVLFPFQNFSGKKSADNAEYIEALFAHYNIKEHRLQPLDTQDAEQNAGILSDTIAYILEHPKWKLSLQTHKILGVR